MNFMRNVQNRETLIPRFKNAADIKQVTWFDKFVYVQGDEKSEQSSQQNKNNVCKIKP